MIDSTLLDPVRLAWLLHTDIRAGNSPRARLPANFRRWWLTHRGLLYPPTPAGMPSEYAALLEPLAGKPRVGPFALNIMLRDLLEWREDLRHAFDLKSSAGYTAALGWFYTHGIREYGLLEHLPPQQMEWLNSSPPAFAAAEDSGERALTWLMYFVWLGSPDLQVQFPLTNQEEQRAYLWWFLFDGVTGLGLTGLISDEWRVWLHAKHAVVAGVGVQVARAAYMLWQYRGDLQQAFDISNDKGMHQLAQWFENALVAEPGLCWLRSPEPKVSASSSAALKTRPFGVNLIGFAFGQLGIGEDVRMAVAACEAADIPFAVVNVHPGNVGVGDNALAEHVNAQQELAPYAINVFCLTGFDTVRVFLERGPELFAGRYNIGWWPWELPVWPHDWDVAFALVDEVWAATTFTEVMYRGAVKRAVQSRSLIALPPKTRIPEVPVSLMPLPANVERVKKVGRKALGLPEQRFLFLYVFDFNSYLDRKNPFATVEAFKRAFPARDKSVGLVLKTMNSNSRNPAWRRFLKACEADPRIQLIDYTLERGEVLGLIRACDAYVSLHRSEGFGRTLAEAQLFGKPVVGTDFSGNVDFLTQETGFPVRWKTRAVKEGAYPFVTHADAAWWADPLVDHAAAQLRLARTAGHDKAFSRRVTRFAKKQFSAERIGAQLRARLEAITAVVP